MKSSVTLIPYGGLANRMKALEALIALIRGTNIYATAIWFKNKGLNCSFEQLFQPLDISHLTLRNAVLSDYLLNDRPRQNNLFIPFFFEKIRFNSCLHEDEVTQKAYGNFDFRFYVASNSREEKMKLIRIFRDRIITDWKPTSRSTPEGIQDALIELYTLSRTQKILGSHYSSYSETAAEIGKIPYEKMNKKARINRPPIRELSSGTPCSFRKICFQFVLVSRRKTYLLFSFLGAKLL